jgi:hypothetical protein
MAVFLRKPLLQMVYTGCFLTANDFQKLEIGLKNRKKKLSEKARAQGSHTRF